MPRREGTAAGARGERSASAGAGRRPTWWRIGIAVVAAIGGPALATVASADRDAYLRTHPPVPDLIGKTVAEAARMMVPLHFGILVTGSRLDPDAPEGVILIQNPPAGRLMPAGTVVQLKVSQGSGMVPRMRGLPVQEAARRLERVGLRLGRVEGIADDSAPGTVLEQFTPPGYQLEANAPVAVMVSNGPEPAASDFPPPVIPDGTPLVPPGAVLAVGATPAIGTTPAIGASPRTPPVSRGSEDASAPGRGRAGTVTPRIATPGRGQEGGPRDGSVATDCAAHAQRERDEVCAQPSDDGGTQPDLYGPEHRDVPASP